jgi:hypothetical protein
MARMAKIVDDPSESAEARAVAHPGKAGQPLFYARW